MKFFLSNKNHTRRKISHILNFLAGIVLLSACAPAVPVETAITLIVETQPSPVTEEPATPTPIATRPVYAPGTPVDYIVQTGDTFMSVAAHFNTTIQEVLEANPGLSKNITTLAPGTLIKVPIYYEALWGNAYQIIPDSLFVNGPAQVGFDTRAFVESQPGWLKNYSSLAGNETRRGGDLIDYIAQEYSISPRLLLAIAEYQAGALTQPVLPEEMKTYPLGYEDMYHKGLYLQMVWAANSLNNGYYGWRSGKLDTITRLNGTIENPDPWQNAATVAIQYYFSFTLPVDEYTKAIYSEGLSKTYSELFGDPWVNVIDHIPGELEQPKFVLPFASGKTWTYTGGPHAAYGDGEPLAAIDFAPPTGVGGCVDTIEYAVAVADGQIVRSGSAVAMLDLDQDGDERTGWVIMYLHLATKDRVRPGVLVKAGDPLGHPSCEGGEATGSHIHIARKYNGEWIEAEGALAFNMEGWSAGNGLESYQGTLKKFGRTVTACTCADPKSQITAGQ